MLCSQLHDQTGLDSILFSYEMVRTLMTFEQAAPGNLTLDRTQGARGAGRVSGGGGGRWSGLELYPT